MSETTPVDENGASPGPRFFARVRGWWPSARTRAWLVVGAVMLGALAGLGFARVQPLQYEALATILIPAPEDSVVPGRHLVNQATIMTSTPVLQRAAELSGEQMEVDLVRQLVSVEASEVADILTVRALGANAEAAERLADAVVESFLVLGQDTGQAEAEAVTRVQDQEGVLRERIAAVERRLRGNRDDPALQAELAALTGDLQNRVTSELRLSLGDVSDRPHAVVLSEGEASRLLDMVLQRVGLGAVIGLVVSIGLVLWWRPDQGGEADAHKGVELRIDDQHRASPNGNGGHPLNNGGEREIPAEPSSQRPKLGRLI
jgi:hypothetical protein